MLKKARIIVGALVVSVVLLVLFGTVHLVMAQKDDSSADGAALVDWSEQCAQAEQLMAVENYTQAESIYRGIVAAYPDTDAAFTAQKGLALLGIAQKNWDAAIGEADLLIAQYSGHAQLAQALYDVAYQFDLGNKRKKAFRYYQACLANNPSGELASSAKSKAVVFYAEAMDYATVNSMLSDLIAALPSGKDLATIIETVGRAISINAYNHKHASAEANNDAHRQALTYFQQAEQMFQEFVPTWRTEYRAIESRFGIINSLWALDLKRDCTKAENELMAEYACGEGGTFLAEVLGALADRYRTVPDNNRAVQLYQYALSQCPGSTVEMDLLANLARANLALADYTAAKPVVAQLKVDYIGQAGFVRRMNEIAWDYHAARKNEEAEAIYRFIMANLAGDEEAVSSQCALVMVKHSIGDKAAAAAELDVFINQFSGNSKKPQFLRKLAYHVYERSKDFETASKLYRLALESTPDAAVARQVRLEYLRTRAMLSTTSVEVEEVLQACVTAVADMAGSNTLHLLPRDSVAAVVGAYATVNPAGDDEPAAIRAANRLVEALGDGASNEQKANILRIAAHGCDRIKNYQAAVELFDKVMKTTPDAKLAQRVMFEYLTARSKLVKTEAEADEVFQGCLTAMANMSDNNALLHDAIVAAIRAYLPVKTQRDGIPVSIHAANRLVEAMSGASDYQQAMAQEVRAWAYSWDGQHEKAVQLLLDMVEDFNGNTDEDVAHLCADALGHAYGYTTVYLKDPVAGQKYLDQISSLGSGGRFQGVADLFRKQVDKRAVNQENLGEK